VKPTPNLTVERYRIREGRLASYRCDGNNGAFILPGIMGRDRTLNVIISDGGGWEHVSVSLCLHPDSPPRWEEMCYVKDLFWGDEECVVQYHPPQSEYRNLHEGCLHLWRSISVAIPRPDPEMVAPPQRGILR
jgi:hypothetical protein